MPSFGGFGLTGQFDGLMIGSTPFHECHSGSVLVPGSRYTWRHSGCFAYNGRCVTNRWGEEACVCRLPKNSASYSFCIPNPSRLGTAIKVEYGQARSQVFVYGWGLS